LGPKIGVLQKILGCGEKRGETPGPPATHRVGKVLLLQSGRGVVR